MKPCLLNVTKCCGLWNADLLTVCVLASHPQAAQCRQTECLVILLKHGADPDIVDSHDNTALHYAVYNGDVETAAKLLEYKANIEATNEVYKTCLLILIYLKNTGFSSHVCRVNCLSFQSTYPLMEVFWNNSTIEDATLNIGAAFLNAFLTNIWQSNEFAKAPICLFLRLTKAFHWLVKNDAQHERWPLILTLS